MAGDLPLYRDTFVKGDTAGWTLQPPINAHGPIPANGTWAVDKGAFVATGTAAPWTIQTRAETAGWTDYSITAAVTVRAAGPKANYTIFDGEYDRYLPREWYPEYCQHPGQFRYRYYAGEFDWGSDAALYFRYQDRVNCYRVQLSSEYQEMILWHGIGGYLQVVPCALEPGKTYQVEVRAQGAHIQVFVDGKKKIDYWHECMPTLSGGIGLAAYRSTVAFQNVKVAVLPPAGAQPPHQPGFATRTWRTQRWIFDGNEPIALLQKNPPPYGGDAFSMYFMKLRPGYRPSYFEPIYVIKDNTQTTGMIGEPKDIKTSGEGTDRLSYSFDTISPDKSTSALEHDTLTYDRTRGTYRHDMTTTVTFHKDMKITSLEYADAFTYNNHAPGRSVKYGWQVSHDEWGIFTAADNKIYRHPISKALLLGEGWYCKPSPSVWMLYPSRGVVPAFEHLAPADPHWVIVCHWGHDYHNSLRWEQGKQVKDGEQLVIRYAFAGYTTDEAERYYRQSELNPWHAKFEESASKWVVGRQVPSTYAFPVCDPAGDTFDELHSVREPFTGWHYVGNYTLDRQVGRTDSYSLRLDGPARVSGQFYHNMLDNYTNRYLCTFWVKTKGLQGKLTAKFKYAYGDKPCDSFVLPFTGDTDWQQISFVTTVPQMTKDNSDSSELVLQNEGTGTVWLDDYSVRPLGDDEKVIEHIPGK
jgi:hypothetical protein